MPAMEVGGERAGEAPLLLEGGEGSLAGDVALSRFILAAASWTILRNSTCVGRRYHIWQERAFLHQPER